MHSCIDICQLDQKLCGSQIFRAINCVQVRVQVLATLLLLSMSLVAS